MTTTSRPRQDARVQPFRIEIPDAQLVDLAERIDSVNLPSRTTPA